MWRDRVLAAQKEKGMSNKAIAEYAQMTEKSVTRILSGKTQSPYVDNVITLGAAVGLTPRELFSETGLVVGDQDLAILQAEVERLTNELAELNENTEELKRKVSELTVENDLLRLKLDHKEELVKHKDDIILLLRAKLGN